MSRTTGLPVRLASRANMFKPFTWRNQAEAQNEFFPLHAELIFMVIGIDKRYIRNAVMN